MTSLDISAINSFVPDAHLFSVKKETNGESHLELIPKSLWNRFRRHFSCSNASMDKVHQYVTQAGLLKNPPSELTPDKLKLFQQKIKSYQHNQARSFCSKVYATISSLLCCRKKPVPTPQEQQKIEQQPQPKQPAPIPPKVERFPVPRGTGGAFKAKFEQSAPERPCVERHLQHATNITYFNAECLRLQKFLTEPPSTADLVYVCMGPGEKTEQVWPGFVLNHLQSGKPVHTLLFEVRRHDWQLYTLAQHYERYRNANGQLYTHFNLFSIDQFLCGLPLSNEKSLDMMSDEAREQCDSGLNSTIYWEKSEQIKEVHKNFMLYIKALLEQGKTVVLADHCGDLSFKDPTDPLAKTDTDFLVETYNALIKTYPKQLYFLWGWEGINRMTNQPIEKPDVNTHTTTAIWTHYPSEDGGLSRCELF